MYVEFNNEMVDSDELKKIIEENTEFKVLKDMSKGPASRGSVEGNLKA